MHHLGERERRAVAGALLAAATAAGGPTPEQQRLVDALTGRVLGLDPSLIEPWSPDAVAAEIEDTEIRRALCEGLLVVELVRHPPSDRLVAEVDEWMAALGGTDEWQDVARDTVRRDREHLAADYQRLADRESIEGGSEGGFVEPGVVGESTSEVAADLQALGELPPGSLGRALFDFYGAFGFDWPAEDHLSLVAHDFDHVIAGYGATPEAEIALQAFLTASSGGHGHFSGLVASLSLFETGLMPFPGIDPKVGVLGRAGAAELFADAVGRGAGVGIDVHRLDHLAMVDEPLSEVRAELNVPAPDPGPFMFLG